VLHTRAVRIEERKRRVMDVTDATFEKAVLERSGDLPVVVDLWASWCGPCRTLGPILERAVASTGGAVELAKVDVDANPRVAATFAVQSIPAVFALRDRKVVDSFIGALPEPAVRMFVESLLPPMSEVDQLLAAGDEASLRQALEAEPANDKVVLALASLLLDAGDDHRDEVLALLARIPETGEVRRLAARARVGDEAGEPAGDIAAKLDSLLAQVKEDAEARREYLDLLELLGPEDPRTTPYRKALANRLF
jgi:putative thioredoxin